MQKSISKVARGWRLILSVLIVGSLISCEDSNSVGGGVIEPAEIVVDTLLLEDYQQDELDIFSGDLSNMPLGKYNDPLFGDFEFTGLMKPILLGVPDDSLNDSTSFKLLLKFDDRDSYGDTTQSINFNIYKVTERWRSSTILSSDDVLFDESTSIGSFSYTDEDSVIVDLAESYFLEYADYVNNEDTNRDSLYNFEFFGLAIVPEDVSSKIVFPNMNESNFLTIKEEDSVSVGVFGHGFNLERENKPVFADRIYLNNYLESFYSLSFEDLAETVDNRNILKAEFYLYEDSIQTKNSLPTDHIRPDINFMYLRFQDTQQLRYSLQFTTPRFTSIRDNTDKSYKFDITDHINEFVFSDPDQREFFLNLSIDGGALNSTIFFDTTANASLRPKIILTTGN
ncbi:MAG: DUF4270 family protein [Balneola sp.]|jgi:hypothetical protein